MKQDMYIYEALVTPSETDGYEIAVPDLDAITQGNDLHDAAVMGHDLIQTYISSCIDRGGSIPKANFGRKAPDNGYAFIIGAMAPVPEDPYMNVSEAAGVLGVTPARVYAMVRDGVLEGEKVGSAVRVLVESVKGRSGNPRYAGRPKKVAL